MAKRCPLCAQQYEGNPRNCPHCGRQIPDYDPTRCEFCGTKVRAGAETCPNCGAPVENEPQPVQQPPDEPAMDVIRTETSSEGTSSTAAPPPPAGKGCGVKLLAAIIIAAVVIPILAAIAIPALVDYARRSREEKMATATPEEMGASLLRAPSPDSVYRAVLEEGENTVETVWPRILLDCPDSCSWLEPYQPCAAFTVTSPGERSLCQFYATASFDLVMALLQRRDDGTLRFLRYDDDTVGRDPQITEILTAGEYLVIVAPLSSFDSGELSFVWEVQLEEVPLLSPDTVLAVDLDELLPKAWFFVEIARDSVYTIQAASDDIDPFIELRTAQGVVLTDDDGGGDWNDSRLVFEASALHEGEAVLVVRSYSDYSPEYGRVTVGFSEGDSPAPDLR